MTITSEDIKLLASERLNDDADGGGYMTGNVIQDGVENNIFPDISEVDRAQGAVDYRKAYLAVLTENQDVYYGAHAIIDQLADDEAISSLLVASTGASEIRSQLISRLNSGAEGDPTGGEGFKGTKPLTIAGDVDDRTVKIDGLTIVLVPTTAVGIDSTGPIVADEGSVTTGRCLIPAGSAGSATAEENGGYLNFADYVIPDSVDGTATALGHAYDVLDSGDASYPVRLSFDGVETTDTFHPDQEFPGKYLFNWAGHLFTASTVTYTPGLAVHLPRSIYAFTFAVGMLSTQFITLPYGSERGSERIEWTGEDGVDYYAQNYGPAQFNETLDDNLTGSINRSSHVLSIVFKKKPKVGTQVRIYYVRSGYAQSLGIAALDGGVFNDNMLEVDSTSGYTLKAATFYIGSTRYELREDSNIYQETSIVGSYDTTTRNLLMIVADGTTVTEWYAVETNDAIPVLSITDAPLPPFMDPETVTVSGTKSAGGTFTATADSTGSFSTAFVTGAYIRSTGKLSLTFVAAVNVGTLEYEGEIQDYTAVSEAVAGVDPDVFPFSGEVQAFRENDLVVIHNTDSLAPLTVSNGQTVDCGRTRISDARVFGDDGIEIVEGFSFSRALGTVTFSDVTGYSQPVTIYHRVEDMATAIAVDSTGIVTLSRPLTHVFDSPGSFVSSVLFMDDLQARAHNGFQMATWTNVWADDLAGSGGTAITADYNEVASPIVMENKGGIEERWLIRFTNTTSFTVTGEQVGQIAVGDTSTNCSPINPATGEPYFTIPFAGWGSGWTIGNAYRFNTSGGSMPFWVIRSTLPSEPYELQDHITVAARGSINV